MFNPTLFVLAVIVGVIAGFILARIFSLLMVVSTSGWAQSEVEPPEPTEKHWRVGTVLEVTQTTDDDNQPITLYLIRINTGGKIGTARRGHHDDLVAGTEIKIGETGPVLVARADGMVQLNPVKGGLSLSAVLERYYLEMVEFEVV